jgi:hypothetical protein
MRRSSVVLFAIGMGAVALVPAAAQQPLAKKGDDIVEVRLADGSAVRMTLIQTHIDVTTRYGKLSVPVADIKKIEFGFRYPEGAESKIEGAVVRLGNANYQAREAAAKELLGYRELAYPALKRALKSSDNEVVKRAEEIMKKIEDKVPVERLKINDNDLIHTIDFTIAGKIESPTLKARSPYFGEISVQLAEARNLRSLKHVKDSELTLEAKFASNTEWMETEIEVASDDPIEIKASGQMLLRPNGVGFECSPAGNMNYANGTNAPGQLLGRIGKSGKTFTIGEHFKGTTGEEGRLYLRVSPSPWGNQMTGSYAVKIVQGNGLEGRTPITAPEQKRDIKKEINFKK